MKRRDKPAPHSPHPDLQPRPPEAVQCLPRKSTRGHRHCLHNRANCSVNIVFSTCWYSLSKSLAMLQSALCRSTYHTVC